MKKLFLIVLMVAALGKGPLRAQPDPIVFTPFNKPAYVEEVRVRISGIRSYGQANQLPVAEGLLTRTYIDGLGRAIQQISMGVGTPERPDLVAFHEYDSLGRQARRYLPYAANTSRQLQTAAVAAQQSFYATTTPGGKHAKDDAPYTEAVFDNSPLGRVLQQVGPGTAWQSATGKVQAGLQRTNTATDNVRQLGPDAGSSGYWPAGSLAVAETVDEEGHRLIAFSDKVGNTVLKREWVDETIQGSYRAYKDTYFLYSAAGLPVMMLPPDVAGRMAATGWVLAGDDLEHNVYRYEYDARGRLVGKKLPSQGWVYLVYDKLDRLCLLQTAEHRTAHKWYFMKYDRLGRRVLEGILEDATRTSRAAMQAYCDTYDYLNPAVPCFEGRGGTVQHYTDQCFPQGTAFSTFEPLVANYYDHYDTDMDGTADHAYLPQGLGEDEPVAAPAQGRLTVARTKVLGSANWLTRAYFYDGRGQLVQQQGNNPTSAAMDDVHTNVYDFAGLLKRSVNRKKVNGTLHTAEEGIAYDRAARPAALTHRYNANATVVLAEYRYNELGQLVDKDLGKTGTGGSVAQHLTLGTGDGVPQGQGMVAQASASITLADGFHAENGSTFTAAIVPSGFLQRVDYRYNIRGWLTHINNASLTADGYNEESDDLFGMELLYEQQEAALGSTALYNGQVSAVKWRAKQGGHPFDDVERAYVYAYDKLGQLRSALFKGRSGTGWNYRNGAFDEREINYDIKGNILTLERHTLGAGGATVQMDKLAYQYGSTGGGDRLQQVSDAWGAAGDHGFKGASPENEHYGYDADGQLVLDRNKGVAYQYNELGKVARITFTGHSGRYIEYGYDGSGQCLEKKLVDGGSTVRTTSYLGSFVAEDGVLSYIATAEGRVRTAGGTGSYEYYIRDQVGRVRVAFEDGGSGVAVVRQENSYYAFGLVHSATIVPSGAGKELLQGAWWEDDFSGEPGLHTMYYRQYDPVLGRFNAVDPMAEKYHDLGVYHFGFNNPVSFADPSGADPMGSWDDFWNLILNIYYSSPYGGTWHDPWNNWNDPWNSMTGFRSFGSGLDAFYHMSTYIDRQGLWNQQGMVQDYATAAAEFNAYPGSGGGATHVLLRGVSITVGNEASYDAANANLQRQVMDYWSGDAFGMGSAVRTTADFVPLVGGGLDIYEGLQSGDGWQVAIGAASIVVDVATLGSSSLIKGGIKTGVKQVAKKAAKGAGNIKYIGRLEDLKGIPRGQTLLDDLPNLGSPKANYYQNMSVLRKALRDGYTIKDASWFRPNSQLAPTLLNPNRTVGQTFLGAERNLLNNRGLWP